MLVLYPSVPPYNRTIDPDSGRTMKDNLKSQSGIMSSLLLITVVIGAKKRVKAANRGNRLEPFRV